MTNMIKSKLVFICFYSLLLEASAENSHAQDRITNLIKNDAPNEKTVLHKSQAYSQKEEGFFSKIASWISPFGKSNTDLTPSAGSHGGPQYLPPPQYVQTYPEKDCHSCNLEPWVPIASSNSHDGVFNIHHHAPEPDIVTGHAFLGLETLNPPPVVASPPNFHHPQFNQRTAKQNFPRPPIDFYGAPQGTYGPPRPGEVVDFMLPPPVLYKPLSQNYGPPKPVYGPPKPVYGPPQKPVYGPPQKPVYGPPKFNVQIARPRPVYGPPIEGISPPPQQAYGPPQQSYGPPQVAYGPPQEAYGPPQEAYGPPQEAYGPPQVAYGLPQLQNPTPVDPNYTPVPQALPLEEKLPPVAPSDSYGAPVKSDILDFLTKDNLGLGSGESGVLDRPIPVPNMSPVPLPPLRNYENFNNGFERIKHDYNSKENEADIQILPSLKVADFLASIEHPINVVQSPIVEVNVKEDILEDSDHAESSNHEITKNKSFGPEGSLKNKIVDSDFKVIKEKVEKNENIEQNKKYNNIKEKISEINDQHHIKLSENPIIVEDTIPSASTIQNSSSLVKKERSKALGIEVKASRSEEIDLTENFIKKLLSEQGIDIKEQVLDIKKINSDLRNHTKPPENNFVTPQMHYGNWKPSYSTEVPRVKTTWLKPVNFSSVSKQKHVQIIVPYVNKNTKLSPVEDKKNWRYPPTTSYTTLVPVYTPPPISNEGAIWTKYLDSIPYTDTKKTTGSSFIKPTTAVYNINELFPRKQTTMTYANTLPYDVITLQKNIDSWTQEEYSNTFNFGQKVTNLAFSKKIPNTYLTSPYTETTTENFVDHQPASSDQKESIEESIESNLVIDSTTTTTEQPATTTLTPTTILWKASHVVLSNATNEKVYVVTPQSYPLYSTTPATAWSMAPKVKDGKTNNNTFETHKFTIKIEPQEPKTMEKSAVDAVRVVFSEWPHKINDLQTTTTVKPTSRHPLFGLMDLIPTYTPASNATVETIDGHSKVATVVTTPSTPSTTSAISQ